MKLIYQLLLAMVVFLAMCGVVYATESTCVIDTQVPTAIWGTDNLSGNITISATTPNEIGNTSWYWTGRDAVYSKLGYDNNKTTNQTIFSYAQDVSDLTDQSGTITMQVHNGSLTGTGEYLFSCNRTVILDSLAISGTVGGIASSTIYTDKLQQGVSFVTTGGEQIKYAQLKIGKNVYNMSTFVDTNRTNVSITINDGEFKVPRGVYTVQVVVYDTDNTESSTTSKTNVEWKWDTTTTKLLPLLEEEGQLGPIVPKYNGGISIIVVIAVFIAIILIISKYGKS